MNHRKRNKKFRNLFYIQQLEIYAYQRILYEIRMNFDFYLGGMEDVTLFPVESKINLSYEKVEIGMNDLWSKRMSKFILKL